MKAATGIVLLLFSFITLRAQHTVSGIVSDKSDKTVLLENVLIYVPEFGRIDLSREGGTYILRNMGIGTVGLQFTKRGYKSVYQVIQTFDSATVVNVEMEPMVGPIQEITELSSLKKQPDFTPFSVQLFSGRNLQRMGNSSILTSLTYRPGFDVFSFGAIQKPMIRGLSLNHVAMVQSGTPVLDNSWNEFYPFNMVEAGTGLVELVKGPASLLYGDNAMGGVLIYRDEKMPAQGVINGDINTGFFANTVGFSIDAGIKGSGKNGTFFSIRAGGISQTSYIQGEGDKVFKNTEEKDYAYHSGYSSGTVKGVFGLNKKWGQSKLSVSYLKSQYELLASLADSDIARINIVTERDRKITEPFVDNSRLLVSSESILLLKKSELKVTLSGESNNRDDEKKNTAAFADVKYISNAQRKGGVVVGAQILQQNIGQIATSATSSFEKSGGGLYLLFRYDLPKINFLAGGRMDSKKVKDNISLTQSDYTIASGSAGLAYHPTEELTIKLNESSGFSIPDQLIEPVKMYDITIRPDLLKKLKEERNYETDFDLTWNTKTISLGLSAFYNLINNYGSLRTAWSGFILYAPDYQKSFTYVQEDAHISGGEFSFHVHPPAVRWLELETSYSGVRGKFENGFWMPYMPADKISSVLRFQSEKMNYMYNSYFSIGLRNYLKQEHINYSSLEKVSDAYSLLDINLGGSFKLGQQMFDISVSANNILNAGYNSHLSRLQALYPVAVREMGRSVSLQFHVPFGLKKSSN